MTLDQMLLFALLIGILGFLLWGKFRHDLVAAGGLLLAVVLGLVPDEDAFSGFSNHAVVIVALVLVASRAFENSGVLAVLAKWVNGDSRPIPVQIGILGGLGAALSAMINNVAALALLMPLDVQAARKAGRAVGITLMPLAFATILGGMVTLIGTPPNIVAAAIRAEHLGAPYGMFDFTPVGLAVAAAGIAFIALIGWRLVPTRTDGTSDLVEETSFEAELKIPEDSALVGEVFGKLSEQAQSADILLVKVISGGRHYSGHIAIRTIRAGDILVVRGATDGIASFLKATGLQTTEEPSEPAVSDHSEETEPEGNGRTKIIEAVVRADSRLIGRTAKGFGLRRWYNLALLGIAREGTLAREQVGDRRLEAGDVLLLSGRSEDLNSNLNFLGLISIDEVPIAPFDPSKAILTAGLFVAAIAAASLGLMSFTVAIAIAVAAYGAFGLVPARDFYGNIDWSVVVMLACLLPIGVAFDRVGGTALVATSIADFTQGASPVIALVLVMVVTMTLSDALNNVATMIVTGPIAIDLARRLDANPDTFLMGVAVAASCAFLTPIGHKNNTLIMGPGGFRFSDYWRMGLPLEIVVLIVAVPMLLWVWPITGTAP